MVDGKFLINPVDGADKTRNSTLEILSQFLGFDNRDDFLKGTSSKK